MKKKFLNLGKQPLANSFLQSISKTNIKKEFFYNLSVSFDTKNYLVSVTNPVNPKKQYTDKYAHRASESKTMRAAFRKTANKLKKKYHPDLVMEIGSNDGVFIKNFPKNSVIAVEPCKNLANLTKKKFKTYPNFWNKKLAKKIFKDNKKADLIFSANTISHIPNIKETFQAINYSLSKNGVLVIEDPSLKSVIRSNSYDQFYDEHVYVFSALAINNITEKYDLKLFDIEEVENHGGSLRYFVSKNESKYKKSKRLKKIIDNEKYNGLNNIKTFNNFSRKVEKSKKELIELLQNLKKKIKRLLAMVQPINQQLFLIIVI